MERWGLGLLASLSDEVLGLDTTAEPGWDKPREEASKHPKETESAHAELGMRWRGTPAVPPVGIWGRVETPWGVGTAQGNPRRRA